ncbi:MAG: sugar phosphate nucleotidyltransferase [Elusimicrobiales bacterium]|nr:sugar phosphate nucleotidyltransferase [Elusimicrobiales bacterium]
MIPAVILAAGGGSRLGETGRRVPKALLPVGDGTLLEMHLRSFLSAGTRKFVIVTDPSDPRPAAEAARALYGTGAVLREARQAERRGIGHAASLAEPFLGGGPFALVLGDTYYSGADFGPACAAMAAGGADAFLSVREVGDEAEIRKECTIELAPDGRVARIIEKPERALSMTKPCGVYFFGPRFMPALKATPASALRGEIELTDAIQGLISAGGVVRTMETMRLDVNVTRPADVIKANRAWLAERGLASYAHPSAETGEGAALENSVAAAGSRIGARARLKDCVVFPGASVPAGTSLYGALVLEDLVVQAEDAP